MGEELVRGRVLHPFGPWLRYQVVDLPPAEAKLRSLAGDFETARDAATRTISEGMEGLKARLLARHHAAEAVRRRGEVQAAVELVEDAGLVRGWRPQ